MDSYKTIDRASKECSAKAGWNLILTVGIKENRRRGKYEGFVGTVADCLTVSLCNSVDHSECSGTACIWRSYDLGTFASAFFSPVGLHIACTGVQ